jgi:hypothetical protein
LAGKKNFLFATMSTLILGTIAESHRIVILNPSLEGKAAGA